MIQSCTVGIDYLGLPPEELEFVSWDHSPGEGCAYFTQVEDDPEHPTPRERVCGNCIYYTVLKDPKKNEKAGR